MRFKISDNDDMILLVDPEIRDFIKVECLSEESRQVLGDFLDFLNDKYVDKNINEEWADVSREKRIDHLLEELDILLFNKYCFWNKHGTGVARPYETLSREELINNVKGLQKTQQKQIKEIIKLRKLKSE